MENLDMKGVIFRNDWHLLSGQQIVNLFNEHYSDVTIQPSFKVVGRLRMLEVGTLELMENRSSSTVYRIKQFDEVYQVFQPKGEVLKFNTEEYYAAKEADTLLQTVIKKEPVFKVESVTGDKVVVMHLKNPRFRALFINNSCDRVEWIDPQPLDALLLAKLMNKAGAFFASYARK